MHQWNPSTDCQQRATSRLPPFTGSPANRCCRKVEFDLKINGRALTSPQLDGDVNTTPVQERPATHHSIPYQEDVEISRSNRLLRMLPGWPFLHFAPSVSMVVGGILSSIMELSTQASLNTSLGAFILFRLDKSDHRRKTESFKVIGRSQVLA